MDFVQIAFQPPPLKQPDPLGLLFLPKISHCSFEYGNGLILVREVYDLFFQKNLENNIIKRKGEGGRGGESMAAYKIYRKKKKFRRVSNFFLSKVTRLHNLQMLCRDSVGNFPEWSQSCKVTKITMHKQIFLQGCKVMEVTRLRRAPFSNFLRNPKSCKVTKVTMSFANSEKYFFHKVARLRKLRGCAGHHSVIPKKY